MINILHLYYDIMNLYGENGNLRAFKKAFEKQNMKVKIDFLSIKDKIDFKKYDIIYIGSGSDENRNLILGDLFNRKKELMSYIENNGYLFLTGNSLELFGSYIEENNEKKDTLAIFNYYTKVLDKNVFKNASNNRIVGSTFLYSTLINKPIIAFQNRNTYLYTLDDTLFKTNNIYSNNENTNEEGFTYKNVYATYSLGPLFIRNPYLLEYFIKQILKEKNLKYKEIKNTTEIKAYEEYLKNFKTL